MTHDFAVRGECRYVHVIVQRSGDPRAARLHGMGRQTKRSAERIELIIHFQKAIALGPSHRADEKTAVHGCSTLWFDASSKGLRDYFSIPHDERVGGKFVRIVGCFRGPDNIGMITVNGSLLDGERRARFGKLRNEGLKEGFDGVRTS
jgi:hypothetical protein